ncbi:MAG: hypothetical protein Q8Q07_05535 [Dehalococcoidales bacterium]|nr:hypothetical protein [Dehalococcoidales bacterium]
MIAQLLRLMDDSDLDGVSALVKNEITNGGQAWEVHLGLFPLVQRALNPPFINPHLPKVYRICREFLPYLSEDDIPALVRLEIMEYTRRPKSEELPKSAVRNSSVSFPEIEAAIRGGDRERVTPFLSAFLEQQGEAELSRNLLLLGSGYMGHSLGHSVSCTAFILLEMMERSDLDPWPALAALADYFCKGQFHTTPPLNTAAGLPTEESLDHYLLIATSGSGIVNLHHTIARYAIERVRHLLSQAEYAHMIARWIEFIGTKSVETRLSISPEETVTDYDAFYQLFSKQTEMPVLSCLAGMLSSAKGRQRIGRYLVKGVCDLYQGDYDPHFLTGLGSALWVVSQYWKQEPIAMNALRQYLNYFFTQRIY